MVRGFLMWNLIVYRLILICTRFASGCRIGELEPFDTVRVHAHISTHALVGANLPSGPLPSLLVGDLVVGLANQTIMSRCLTGVAAIASPTYCAQSAESMVPESASLIRSPVRSDRNVDDGLCSALLSPKPPSTIHDTAGVLGNATWAMCIRIGQVVHAMLARAPWLSVLVPAAWSTSALGHFGRFVHGACVWAMRGEIVDAQMTPYVCLVMCGSMVSGHYVATHVHQHAVLPIMLMFKDWTANPVIASTWTWVCTQVVPTMWTSFVSHLDLSWTLCVAHFPSVVLLMWHLCLGRHRLRAAGIAAALVFVNCVLPGNLSVMICLLSWMYSIYPRTRAAVCLVHTTCYVHSRIDCALCDDVQI